MAFSQASLYNRLDIMDNKEMNQSSGRTADELVQAVNVSKGETVIAQKIVWAGTSALRRKGLLGRESLGSDEGMYIVPCGWVHTFRMKFPIDVAFLSSSGRVLSIQRNMKPNHLSKLIIRASGVLELAAGQLQATNTSVGDIVKFKNSQ